MSLSDLASLGAFMSGIAVLASLVFLFFQMRQMTEQVRQAERNQRALLSQGNINRVGEFLRWNAEPHVAELANRVSAGETAFTRLELKQLELLLRQTLMSVQEAHVQHQSGLSDTTIYEDALLAITRLLGQPVYRALWKITRREYATEWTAFVDRVAEETALAKPVDFVGRFNTALGELAPSSKAI